MQHAASQGKVNPSKNAGFATLSKPLHCLMDHS
jgi:hypothetical protein